MGKFHPANIRILILDFGIEKSKIHLDKFGGRISPPNLVQNPKLFQGDWRKFSSRLYEGAAIYAKVSR